MVVCGDAGRTLVVANSGVNLPAARYLVRMGKIKSPRPSSTRRFDDCQEAIEDQLQDLIAEASAAGWSKAETLAAVIEVSENLAIGLGDDQELAAILNAVRKMK